MAEETLRWSLEFEASTGKLKPAALELERLSKELEKLRGSFYRLSDAERSFSGFGRRWGETASRLESFTSRARRSFEHLGLSLQRGAQALGTFGLSAEEALSAFGERQGALRAYVSLLGEAKEAEIEFRKAQALALRTELSSAQVEKAQKGLLTAGFRGKDLDRALLTVADLAAIASPQDRELMAERVSRALGQVLAKGRLQGEELRQLAEAGVSRRLVLEHLAGPSGDAFQIEKKISRGEVSAEEGLAAIQRAVLKQLGTRELGQFAVGAAGSLSGLLSNREEAFRNLLKSFDSEVLPGSKLLKESLTDLTSSLSAGSEEGKALSLALQDLSSTSLGLRAAWEEFTHGFLASFAQSYLEAVGDNADSLRSLAKVARDFGEALGGVASIVAKLPAILSSFAEFSKAVAIGLQDLWWLLRNPRQLFEGNWLEKAAAAREAKERELRAGFEEKKRLLVEISKEEPPRLAAEEKPARQIRRSRLGRQRFGSIAQPTFDFWAEQGPEAFHPFSHTRREELRGEVEARIRSVAPPEYNLTVHGGVKIEVSSSAASAREVAEEVLLRLGRLARTPAPSMR